MAHTHDHSHSSGRERLTDVAVIGGSAAGLAASLQLARTRRDVIVLDAGDPRNAPTSHTHGYLGHEDIPPVELAEKGREEVRSYGVEILDRLVTSVEPAIDGRFRVELADGGTVLARRILAATGLVDELPAVDGIADHWGSTVLHCPFCHGYEARDRRLVQLVIHPLGLHLSPLLDRLAGDLTVVLHEGVDPASPEVERLRAAHIRVLHIPARKMVTGTDGRLAGVELIDGTVLDTDAVLTGVRFRPRAEAFAPLGLMPTPHATGLGTAIATETTGATAVPGVYAAGNVTDPSHQLLQAAADGSRVGAHLALDLADEDLGASRTRAGELEWDDRFEGEPSFSGNPNGALVAEVAELAPGRALDIGAGEGADAVWLAEQGWDVTATDISARGLDQVRALAADANATVRCLHVDAGELEPYGQEHYDLVSAQYAAIPRSPDGRAVHNLLDAVAPDGTLLVVHHDSAAMRNSTDTSPLFDPDAFLTPGDVAAAVEASPDFDLLIDERRPRPAGHATIDVADVVVRARRRS